MLGGGDVAMHIAALWQRCERVSRRGDMLREMAVSALSTRTPCDLEKARCVADELRGLSTCMLMHVLHEVHLTAWCSKRASERQVAAITSHLIRVELRGREFAAPD